MSLTLHDGLDKVDLEVKSPGADMPEELVVLENAVTEEGEERSETLRKRTCQCPQCNWEMLKQHEQAQTNFPIERVSGNTTKVLKIR